jgi:hypothetical protein
MIKSLIENKIKIIEQLIYFYLFHTLIIHRSKNYKIKNPHQKMCSS